MKKKVFRERYYGEIDTTGENHGNKKIIKDKTTKVKNKETKKGKKND
jgi:hypothetical protein